MTDKQIDIWFIHYKMDKLDLIDMSNHHIALCVSKFITDDEKERLKTFILCMQNMPHELTSIIINAYIKDLLIMKIGIAGIVTIIYLAILYVYKIENLKA